MKRFVHFNSNGFVKGSTKMYEKGEGCFIGEVIVILLTGAIALFGLLKIHEILSPWLFYLNIN